jgi:hypothetical protein
MSQDRVNELKTENDELLKKVKIIEKDLSQAKKLSKFFLRKKRTVKKKQKEQYLNKIIVNLREINRLDEDEINRLRDNTQLKTQLIELAKQFVAVLPEIIRIFR